MTDVIMGISSGYHDASVTIIEDGKIAFAGHSERYSRRKNDHRLNRELIKDALRYASQRPDTIAYHEKNYNRILMQIRTMDLYSLLAGKSSRTWMEDEFPNLSSAASHVAYNHHQTHAAAGVLTSKFTEAAVMVIDAIGEFDTASIWHWKDGALKRVHRVGYPSSLGLFYSAMTKHVGLRPNEDEHILMGMAAYGDRDRAISLSNRMMNDLFCHDPSLNDRNGLKMKRNLHRGLPKNMYKGYADVDIARAAQIHLTDCVLHYARRARELTGCPNLVYMGGVALNCALNPKLLEVFDAIHIMPNPGDAGSSLGAAALSYYEKTGKLPTWEGPYLGHDISGEYPVDKAYTELVSGGIVGVASGRAEFGPRAFGNRSILADPRVAKSKVEVNTLKRRQQFRPFAPIVMEEHASEYFDLDPRLDYSYMQYVARCKKPNAIPAVVHYDGTSRVQTVNAVQHPGLYALLSKFYDATGCPVLLNTSLNVRGMPIVNDSADAMAARDVYKFPIVV